MDNDKSEFCAKERRAWHGGCDAMYILEGSFVNWERKREGGQRGLGQWDALMGCKNRYCIPRFLGWRQRRGISDNVVVGLNLVILCFLDGELILLIEGLLVRHSTRVEAECRCCEPVYPHMSRLV